MVILMHFIFYVKYKYMQYFLWTESTRGKHKGKYFGRKICEFMRRDLCCSVLLCIFILS